MLGMFIDNEEVKMVERNMLQSWVDLFEGENISTSRLVQAYYLIEKYYGESHRRYHTLEHVRRMLDALDLYFPDAPREVKLAIWLHDVIYDPKRKDNEVRSGEFAIRLLHLGLGLPLAVAEYVYLLIVTTVDHVSDAQGLPGSEMLCDLDLLSLGTDSRVYQRNTAKIRYEYRHGTDEQWAMGRRVFIKRFLDREYIYATPRIRELFEQAARRNLRNERRLLP